MDRSPHPQPNRTDRITISCQLSGQERMYVSWNVSRELRLRDAVRCDQIVADLDATGHAGAGRVDRIVSQLGVVCLVHFLHGCGLFHQQRLDAITSC